ncbi:MAG TPA: hypothetical protein VGX94_04545 [Terriglobia bacterium]|nr:hypothetical protein [Terriglobia bacterium]
MYSILVDFFLIALIAAIGAVLFFGSVMILLAEAGSQAVAGAAKKYAHAVANIRVRELQPAQLQPERAVSRAQMRA